QQKRDSRELERRGSTVTRHSASLSTTSSGSAPAKPRTVFQGSKHTRTLSLLANNQSLSFPQPSDINGGNSNSSSSTNNRNPPSVKPTRAVTMPHVNSHDKNNDSSKQVAAQLDQRDIASLRRALVHNPTAEAFMKTGQQLAVDLKDNLWTFFEDIRQAAVGEELTNANSRSVQGQQQHQTNRASSNDSKSQGHGHSQSQSSSRSRSKPIPGTVSLSQGRSSTPHNRSASTAATARGEDDDAAFWRAFGLDVAPSPRSSGNGRSSPPRHARGNSSISSVKRGSSKSVVASQRQQQQQHQQEQRQHHQQRQQGNLLDFDDDNWDVWDHPTSTPHPHAMTASAGAKPISHTPSSSTSTWPSKRSMSPSTAASSPPLSARFATTTKSPALTPDPVPVSVPDPEQLALIPALTPELLCGKEEKEGALHHCDGGNSDVAAEQLGDHRGTATGSAAPTTHNVVSINGSGDTCLISL
ncbi:hypothetical protein KEM55_007613, partial [Ascosphaera atra]